MHQRRPPKLHPECYRGPQPIFLTMCTFERNPAFEIAGNVERARVELLRTSTAYDIELLAYCFMPDHLHALLEGISDRADAAKCVAMFRQRSGHDYRRRTGRRLWQEGYF